MGSKQLWDKAEAALQNAMKKKKMDFKINEGDGAFYGPKIDFHIKDSLGRTWQCATIQLDFSMPEKFDLTYIDKDDKAKRPVMIHRVIYGSMERFFGILIEHYGGAFPLWLNPTQVSLIAIADRHVKYAEKIGQELEKAKIRVVLDSRQQSVSSKVRDAQLKKIPYILVIGDREEKEKTATVRLRSGKVIGALKIDKFIERLQKEIEEKK